MFSDIRNYSATDLLIYHLDKCMRTLLPPPPNTPSTHPGAHIPDTPLPSLQARQVAAYMRINHSGEVCAQALYLGQSLTARDPGIRAALKQAAEEETAHLAWCQSRLQELNARTSYLNPLWFVGSLGIGVVAGLIGDRISLGFLHETENQVVRHLQTHLTYLPASDLRSRAILGQMITDEAEHATLALQQGGVTFPIWARLTMRYTAKFMTTLTYYV